jgi:hypothetical protein
VPPPSFGGAGFGAMDGLKLCTISTDADSHAVEQMKVARPRGFG